MISQTEALDILQKSGVLLQGHFRLTSGRHSDKYMQCARVFQWPDYAQTLCRALAEQFTDIDVVVGPAVGAIQMAYEVSRYLGCRNIFAERENGVFTLRRGFAINPGERVLVVEDAVTTGGSVLEVLDLVKACGGVVAGVGALVDRSGGKADFGVDFRAVVRLDIVSWTPEECPLCQQGLAWEKPGSRTV